MAFIFELFCVLALFALMLFQLDPFQSDLYFYFAVFMLPLLMASKIRFFYWAFGNGMIKNMDHLFWGKHGKKKRLG